MGGLGMPEIMIILVIALIVFGPRKLPELGKSLGKAMGQFKRASEDFKRTWEQEVDLEKTRSSIAATSESGGTEHSSNYDANHHSYDGSYDPYNSEYGYNAPSDAETATATAPLTESVEPATAEAAATPAQAANKSQPGQWI
ncbi:MAG: TatA/E family twin arginine-targeting protein translocase [Acidobacteria bacterium]|nr:TatA/E family twin arginine-targeting protein translocase [Acidobacteriota bacterium]